VHRGALALNYAKATGFLYENGKISGATITDELTGESFSGAGPAGGERGRPLGRRVDTLNDPAEGEKLFLTKGVHLVVDGDRLPVRQAAYFDTTDGRMVFAIPREGKTYVGTTDTPYAGNTAHPDVTADDVAYLLGAVNRTFPGVHLQPADVESSWAGLRPLIRQKGKGPGEISRKDEIFRYDSGLITIAGGKLTGYRKMAERIVDLVAGRLLKATGKSFGPCITARLRLSGGDLGGDTLEGFVREKTRQGELLGLPAAGSPAAEPPVRGQRGQGVRLPAVRLQRFAPVRPAAHAAGAVAVRHRRRDGGPPRRLFHPAHRGPVLQRALGAAVRRAGVGVHARHSFNGSTPRPRPTAANSTTCWGE
jgi:glycerol-3-phosphate dehydrogenase